MQLDKGLNFILHLIPWNGTDWCMYRGLDEYGVIVERSKKDGAFLVISEEYIHTPRFKELISDLPKPKLALNCGGGKAATNLARLLG